uniref:Protein kinase domain-containing protein n=1 Tax=Ascaris lumbricoides TaxID=6252 RepID=A0A9J2PYA2_ASCLU
MSQATPDESLTSIRINFELKNNGVWCEELIVEDVLDSTVLNLLNVYVVFGLYECSLVLIVIGRGTYSTVKKAWSSRQHKTVAIKIIDKRLQSRYIKDFLPRELRIVPTLNHDNIIKVYDVIHSGPFVCLVEEYANNGDLLRRIKGNIRLNEDESRFYFRQLIEALMYLKSIKVAHRDLKCENILLDSCDNVKLCDFGFARMMKDGDVSRTFCGSRAYAAPEILRQIPYNGFTVDVWSAAIVLYIMITGVMPYNSNNPRKMLNRQLQHRLALKSSSISKFSRSNYLKKNPENFILVYLKLLMCALVSFPKLIFLSDDVKELLYQMLHPSPSDRITYQEMLDSRWLANTHYFIRTESMELTRRKAMSSEAILD